MLKFNYNTMRYERIDDKRPDLLAEKLADFGGYDDYIDCTDDIEEDF